MNESNVGASLGDAIATTEAVGVAADVDEQAAVTRVKAAIKPITRQ